jgi:small subunit ribosomal protein S2
MAVVTMKALLETGVHFGHRTRKWNPKMKSYIFTERNGIHIIDLQQTLDAIEVAYGVVRDIVSQGRTVLFVGTKRQAQDSIEVEAKRCGMPYVNARWLGGTLTNWSTISSRIKELEALEKRRDAGEFERLTKKENLMMARKIDRLQERLGGIREMKALPGLVFVVDIRREETAVHEANLLGIPVLALVDTNCDPRPIDYIIPSNDDAIRAIKLLSSKIADAVLEGSARFKEEEEALAESAEEEGEPVAEVVMAEEDLLGEATLAKLQTGAFDEKKEEKKDTESEKGEEKPAAEAEAAPEDEKQDSAEQPEAEKGPEPEAEAPSEAPEKSEDKEAKA